MPAMGTLYLVRHGQASFGAADYDQLSELGAQQCLALGQWFAQQGLHFDAVLTGSLRRHAQSLQAISTGHRDVPAAIIRPGLNEYDPQALVRAFMPELDLHPGLHSSDPAQRAEIIKGHFRLLRQSLAAWMAGSTQPAQMPAWPDFLAGVVGALDEVRNLYTGNVLIVSSGGPIATAVGHVLGAGTDATIELNLRIRNSAVTEFAFNAKRHHLLSFNHLPHLHAPERAGWQTYA